VSAAVPFLLAVAVLAQAAREQPFARLSIVPASPGFVIDEVLSFDFDQDGAADVVYASHAAGASGSVRRIAVHLRRARTPVFEARPDHVLDTTPDVVAFAVADVHRDAGCELVLFGARAAFAWRPHAAEAERFVKLAACEFLWQFPDPLALFAWQAGIVDLDVDGLSDLLLPGPGGQRLAFQRRVGDEPARFDPPVDLRLPAEPPVDAPDGSGTTHVSRKGGTRRVAIDSGALGFELGGQALVREPLVRIDESVPAAQCVDWDADGDLDVLALGPRMLHVFVQPAPGSFDPSARLALESPVVRDRARTLDVSYVARALDVDGDRRGDCVIFAGDQRAEDVRTQVLVFLQGAVAAQTSGKPGPPLFGARGIPAQVLVLDGFARPLRAQDVDGDGRDDLIVATIEPDLLDTLRNASSDRVAVQLYVYKAGKRGFSPRPDLFHDVALRLEDLDYALDFIGDLTGDGTSELLERTDERRFSIRMTRRTREGLAIAEKPLYELAIEPAARLVVPGRLQPGSWDLFVAEGERVTCVSFR
jgi:hypothetical protein